MSGERELVRLRSDDPDITRSTAPDPANCVEDPVLNDRRPPGSAIDGRCPPAELVKEVIGPLNWERLTDNPDVPRTGPPDRATDHRQVDWVADHRRSRRPLRRTIHEAGRMEDLVRSSHRPNV